MLEIKIETLVLISMAASFFTIIILVFGICIGTSMKLKKKKDLKKKETEDNKIIKKDTK